MSGDTALVSLAILLGAVPNSLDRDIDPVG